MSMFASASQLVKPAKRTAEQISSSSPSTSSTAWRTATQPEASSGASWKRVKSDSTETTPMTQPVVHHRPMLGAWFGAARAATASTSASQQYSVPAASQSLPSQYGRSTAFARVKSEATTSLSQESEDDRPLARVTATKAQHQQQHQAQRQQQQRQQLHPRDWKQQKELQRLQAKAKATTSSPPQGKAGFQTAREVAREKPSTEERESTSNAAAASRVSGSEDERVFQLSTKRRVTVRRWKSAVLVDIREYYDDNGVSKPGKKGISLAKDQWNTLMRMASVIDDAVALVEDDNVAANSMMHVKENIPVNDERTIAFTLSSKRRITIRFFRSAVLIDLREYYEQGSEMKPGKKGISLSKDQWRSLQQTEAEIAQAMQDV